MPIPTKPAPDDEEAAPAPDQQQAAPPDDGSGGMMPDDEGASDQQGSGDEAEGGEQQQGTPATPEQQAQYAKFVDQGYHLIYAGGKVNPAILKSLASAAPVKALATTTVEIVMRLIVSAKQQNIQLDSAVELHGGMALYQEIADLASKAKIHTYTQTEIDSGWVLAMALAQAKLKAIGALDPATFKQEADELNKAQQDGSLDHVFPALGQVVNKIGPDVEKGLQQKQGAGAPPPDQQQQPPQPMPAGGSGGMM